MSDLPVALPAELEPAFLGAFDPQAKLVAALGALGPVADRDVLVVDATAGPVVEGLTTAGGRIVSQPLRSPLAFDSGDGSSDVVLGLWSAFRGVEPTEVAEVDRVPPAGRTPPRRARLRSRRRIPPVRSGPTGIRRLEPPVRTLPPGRLPGPGGALLLGVREPGGGRRIPRGRVRRGGRDRRRDASATLLQRRRLPSLAIVMEEPPGVSQPLPGQPPDTPVTSRRGGASRSWGS